MAKAQLSLILFEAAFKCLIHTTKVYKDFSFEYLLLFQVEDLRPDLMTKDFVAEFLMLVDSTSDGIETSYNAAGVLAHMASDGAEGKHQFKESAGIDYYSIFCRNKNVGLDWCDFFQL